MKSRKKPTTKVREMFEEAKAARVHGEEPEWPEWVYEEDLMGLLELMHIARNYKQIYDAVRSELEDRVADNLGEGAAVTDGRTFYRVAPERERVVDDPHFLADWLADDIANVVRIDGRSVSVERFRQCAAMRLRDHGWDDEDKIAAEVLNLERTFFRIIVHPGGKLVAIPLDNQRIPRYARQMEPGVVRQPSKKEADSGND